MDLESKIEILNFTEVGEELHVVIEGISTGEEYEFKEKVVDKNSSLDQVEVITDHVPPWSSEDFSITLYATDLDNAFEGEELAFGSECYATVPEKEDNFEISKVEVIEEEK